MKRVLAAVAALMPVVTTVGCGQDVVGMQEITSLPRELGEAEAALIESDNAFGLKLFGQVYNDEDKGANIFISPLSVAMALGMAYNGANTTTRDAMEETLELEGLSLQELDLVRRAVHFSARLPGREPRVFRC